MRLDLIDLREEIERTYRKDFEECFIRYPREEYRGNFDIVGPDQEIQSTPVYGYDAKRNHEQARAEWLRRRLERDRLWEAIEAMLDDGGKP